MLTPPRHEARGNSRDWPHPTGPTICRFPPKANRGRAPSSICSGLRFDQGQLSLTCAVDGFAIPACGHNPSSLKREHGFFSDPPRYRVPVKSPIGANSEARDLTALGQLVTRARVNTEQVTKFRYRQNFVIARHVEYHPYCRLTIPHSGRAAVTRRDFFRSGKRRG